MGIIVKDAKNLGSYTSRRHRKRDTVYCFYTNIDTLDFTIDEYEILCAKWFLKEEVPENHSPGVDDIFTLLI